jgi:AraC-like DNA-binding protein
MFGRSLFQSFLSTPGPARALVWKYSPEFRRPRHFHSEPEVNLIVTGSASFGVGETVVKAAAGELLGFPAGQDHVLLNASADFNLFAIGMDPTFSTDVLRADRHSVEMPLHIRLEPQNFKDLVTRCSAIVDQSGVDQQVAELWEQLNWLRQMHWRNLKSAMHVLTRRTLSTVSDAPDLGRAMLARHVRASPSEISRYFHRDLGMTLTQYRTRLRLLRFIRLVDARAVNLTAAATAAGFGSYSQCHRMFQAEFSCAPRDFFATGLRQQMQLAYLPVNGW